MHSPKPCPPTIYGNGSALGDGLFKFAIPPANALLTWSRARSRCFTAKTSLVCRGGGGSGPCSLISTSLLSRPLGEQERPGFAEVGEVGMGTASRGESIRGIYQCLSHHSLCLWFSCATAHSLFKVLAPLSIFSNSVLS